MEINICRRNKYGYCKYGDKCHFRHEKVICNDSNCNIFNCERRHPKVCGWYQQYGKCKFTSFKHVSTDNIENLRKRVEENTTKLSEIEKALEAIKKEEGKIQNKIEVFEKELEKRFVELENKFTTSVNEFIEKNNEKVLHL